MGTLTKQVLQRTISIMLDAANVITHASQITISSVLEDGVEISRSTSNAENVEPADLASALPQADILAQLNDAKTALAQEQTARVVDAQAHKQAIAELTAARQTDAETHAQAFAQLTTAHDDVVKRNAAAVAALAG